MPEDESEYNDLYKDWMESEGQDFSEPPDWDTHYGAIQHRIAKYKKKRKSVRNVLWGLAVMILVSGASLLFFTKQHSDADTKELSHNEIISNTTDVVKVLILQDSTKVLLYPHSMLTFNTGYNNTNRKLWLNGMADFDVHKNAALAFIVYSDNLAVKAIGTRFVVSNKKPDAAETVLLKEGIVQVDELTAGKPSKILAVNDMLVRNRSTGTITIVKAKQPADKQLKAKPGVIKNKTVAPHNTASQPQWYAFDNAALPAIFDNLELMYGVRIRYNKSQIKDLHFIGRFDQADKLEHIIKVITSLNDLKYKKNTDGSYEIYK